MYVSMGNNQTAEKAGSFAVFATILAGTAYFMFPELFGKRKKSSRSKPRRRVARRRHLPG